MERIATVFFPYFFRVVVLNGIHNIYTIITCFGCYNPRKIAKKYKEFNRIEQKKNAYEEAKNLHAHFVEWIMEEKFMETYGSEDTYSVNTTSTSWFGEHGKYYTRIDCSS